MILQVTRGKMLALLVIATVLLANANAQGINNGLPAKPRTLPAWILRIQVGRQTRQRKSSNAQHSTQQLSQSSLSAQDLHHQLRSRFSDRENPSGKICHVFGDVASYNEF
ncbi:unnamed protein product [Cylicocyclus nassatus]|uniref:Secreted protein n=1 Tax=Cylicocyclus nassatus TaxID=53992 RepID=A0AA36GJQ5_CYLNA|nr:unnamed protein product [Cylicocyclus nassatus]